MGPLPSVRTTLIGVQVTAIALGLLALWETTWLTADLQVPSAVVPWMLALAVEAFWISCWLSARLIVGSMRAAFGGVRQRVQAPGGLALHLAASFFGFFGWSMVVLGFLLPWNIFGFCQETCVYPYVLSGFALTTVLVGVAFLGAGAAALAVIALLARGGRRTSPRGASPVASDA